MATSQVAPDISEAFIVSSTASTAGETIVGSHIFTINGFSATKDVGVGKSIRSSIFRVGGHDWYIECYPCGDDEESAGWVTLFLFRQYDDHDSRVLGSCIFSLMESDKDGCLKRLKGHPYKSFNFIDDDGHWQHEGTDFIKREELESLLMDDSFHVRCTVCVPKFPALPQPDLANNTVAGSHVLTVDEYLKTREGLNLGDPIVSYLFRVGELCWRIRLYPCGEYDGDANGVTTYLCLEDAAADDEVKVRFEMALITDDGPIISSLQNFNTFTESHNAYGCYFLGAMELESSPLLHGSIHIRCDITVVDGITAMQNPCRGIGGHLQLQGSQHVRVRGDVTFEVDGHLFAAHKSVLSTRCAALMAEFFGHARKDNTGVTDQLVHIDHMVPRVFEALLHFIYTDALPDLTTEDDKVGMAQGLLVVADRYAMERLKLICGDLLCGYVTDARTAVTTLDLADKHGCRRLKQACMKFLMDHFVNVAP